MKKFIAVALAPRYDTAEEALKAAQDQLKSKTLENQVFVAEIIKVVRRCTDVTVEDV